MTDAQQYNIRCAHCGTKTQADESVLGERIICPVCTETFTIPAFPDPDAGVELIEPTDLESAVADPGDADSPDAAQEEDSIDVGGAGTWTPIILGLIVLVFVASLLIWFNSAGTEAEVLPEEIVIIDRKLERISDEEIKWYVTVVNTAQATAEVSLELEVYNSRGVVIHRDETGYLTIKPGHRRKLQRTSDYYSGDRSRPIHRYEVVTKFR